MDELFAVDRCFITTFELNWVPKISFFEGLQQDIRGFMVVVVSESRSSIINDLQS